MAFDVAAEEELLRRSCLRALSDVSFERLMASARRVELSPGTLVYDPQVSIVLSGVVRAFIADGSRQLTVATVVPPRAFGVAMVAGRRFPVAYQALAASSVVRIPQTVFDELRRRSPEIGWAVAEELAQSLDSALDELSLAAFRPMRARIAHHLLVLSDPGVGAARPVHQADLVAAVGSVREVVNRGLNGLRDSGLIAITERGIVAVDEAGLRKVAAEG